VGKRAAVRGDRRFVSAGRGTGDDGLRRLAAELFQGAEGERKAEGSKAAAGKE